MVLGINRPNKWSEKRELSMTELGLRLRALREEKQLTQEQLARLTDIPYNTYRKYEMSSVKPRKENLDKLANFYNMPSEEILGIGTILTLEYDPIDIEQLQATIRSVLPDDKKVEALGEILNRLYDQKEESLAVQEMNDILLTLFRNKSVRTVRYSTVDEELIRQAEELRYSLMKKLYDNAIRKYSI